MTPVLQRLRHLPNSWRYAQQRHQLFEEPAVLVLNASATGRPILVGRPAGKSWSARVGLDRLPPTAPVILQRDPSVYAVSSSFWLGALTPRILAAGSLPEFLARHRLDLNPQDREGLTLCVARVLMERTLRKPWWQRFVPNNVRV